METDEKPRRVLDYPYATDPDDWVIAYDKETGEIAWWYAGEKLCVMTNKKNEC